KGGRGKSLSPPSGGAGGGLAWPEGGREARPPPSKRASAPTALRSGLQDLQTHFADVVLDALTVFQHVRGTQVGAEGVQALPLFDDDDRVGPERGLHRQAGGDVDGGAV